LFGIKSTLFDNKKDIFCEWSVTCSIIGWTLVAHGRICVHKRLNKFFQPPLTLGGLFCSFHIQMEVSKWL
jgi:hypothetical protein